MTCVGVYVVDYLLQVSENDMYSTLPATVKCKLLPEYC